MNLRIFSTGNPKRHPPGFTLIEVVIAITVLAIAVSVLLNVMASLTAETVYPEFLNTATYLAEEEFDKVAVARFSEVVNLGPVAYTGDFSDYNCQIAVSPVPEELASDPGMNHYKQVQITVRHSRAGGITLTTLVTNH